MRKCCSKGQQRSQPVGSFTGGRAPNSGMGRLTIALLWASVAGLAATRYEIDLSQASSHILTVTVDAECRTANCDLQMPVWNAMYQIRDFAQFVSRFEAARASGEP